MDVAGAAIFAVLAGIAIGFAVGWWLGRRRPDPKPRRPVDAPPASRPAILDGMPEVLAVLRAAGVVVGPHDEVLHANQLASTLGVVRGSRVAITPILDLVRRTRREQASLTEDLDLSRTGRASSAHYHVRVAPLPDQQILLLVEDETAARRIEQTRRDFVANVSHELKTPIGALSLLAEAVQEAADDPVAVRRFAARMGIESARLTDLVSQIIDLSRLQADNPLSSPEVVQIDEVLMDAVDRCRVDAERHGVVLTVAGAEGCTVIGDLRQLGIAVGNLVENAVVYSDPGARVVVAAHRQVRNDDEFVEITVSDNGIGIPAREQDRIFERFYRVDYARSRANGGTGLGLAIVKHVAASHNGDVKVWSKPGQGSTFTISLPAHQPSLAEAPSAGDTHAELARPIALVPGAPTAGVDQP